MIHVALCAIAIILAWRTPEVKKLAIAYGAIQSAFWAIREPATHYGELWWFLVISIELLTMAAILKSNITHWSSKWVMWVTISAIAVNLACIPNPSFVYDYLYDYMIPCSEYARAACIIIASNPVWSRLIRWHRSRQRKEFTWLARLSTQEPRLRRSAGLLVLLLMVAG